MKRALLFCVVLAVMGTTAASAGGAPGKACKAGIHKIGKTTYRVFCGPASASITVAGKKHSFRSGSCLKIGSTKVFALAIGKLAITKTRARYSYLSVTIPLARRDGLYRGATVAWAYGGKRHLLSNSRVKLAGKRTRGTFSGRLAGRKNAVTGSFRCK
jgi:hypothetical protein